MIFLPSLHFILLGTVNILDKEQQLSGSCRSFYISVCVSELWMDRRRLDDAFPTVVRYCGVVLTVVLVIASILGHGVELAAGYVAAAGMILYKTVKGAAENGNSNSKGKEDRWSHLP